MKYLAIPKQRPGVADRSCDGISKGWKETAVKLANLIMSKYPEITLAGTVMVVVILEIPDTISVENFEKEFDCIMYKKV